MTTLPIETCTAARAASNDDLPLEKAVVEAMAEEMGKSHVWGQGYESMLPSERQKAPKTAASYLDMFFKEKRIPSKVFEVTDSQGITHSIPNQVVIDMIKQTRGRERASIEDTLRKIDFGNGDVNHFLAHLAKGLAEQYSGTLRFASQQEAEKLEAEAEANEQQAQADRAKAEAAQMRGASSGGPFQAQDVDRKLGEVSEYLIENDFVFILDPKKRLNLRQLKKDIQEGVAEELADRSVTRRNPEGNIYNAKDIDLDVEWSEDIDDGIPGWDVKPSQGSRLASREASGGLYGYTKGTQNDVEASVRKAQRRANSIAKTLYARDERSVDFLKAHAKRANSKTARLILAAMKNIGPRVASDKTAALLPSERHASIFHGSEEEQLEYVVDALRLAGSQGLRVDSLPRKGVYAAQVKGFAEAERGQLFITPKGKSVRMASERHAADRKWFVTKRGGSAYSGPAWKGDKPRWFDSEKEAKTWAKKLGGRNPAGFSVEQIPEGFTAGKYPRQMRGKTAGGLYGHPTKTARLALVACSDLRAYVGEVAYSLHSRRTAKYAKMTGFLKEHGKTAKCAYSRMILDCYPEAPQVAKQASMTPASEMLKKAFVPDSVDGWLEWADGTRTAADRYPPIRAPRRWRPPADQSEGCTDEYLNEVEVTFTKKVKDFAGRFVTPALKKRGWDVGSYETFDWDTERISVDVIVRAKAGQKIYLGDRKYIVLDRNVEETLEFYAVPETEEMEFEGSQQFDVDEFAEWTWEADCPIDVIESLEYRPRSGSLKSFDPDQKGVEGLLSAFGPHWILSSGVRSEIKKASGHKEA